MSHSSNEWISRHSESTNTGTASPEDEETAPQSPNSSSAPTQALPDFANANSGPAPLACPVSGCSSVFMGKTPHGYLWRHLGRPRAEVLIGDEKAAWEKHHKRDRDKVLPTRLMPAQRKREARGVEGRNERTARFEQRARDMGITGEALVAQKVKIWEGTRVAKQNGEDIEHDALVLWDFFTNP